VSEEEDGWVVSGKKNDDRKITPIAEIKYKPN